MADKIIHFMPDVRSQKRSVGEGFIGTCASLKLEGYDSDYVDLCGPAKMKISPRATVTLILERSARR